MITETESTITVQLKSCPFCGGAASVSEQDRGSDATGATVWCIECNDCPAMMDGDWDDTTTAALTKLVAAWNHEPPVRAER